MSAVADSRKKVLDAIRAATGGSASRNVAATAAEGYSDIPRDYVRRGDMTVSARQERFVERLREYDAEVVECAPNGLAAAITAQIAASGKRKFVAPPEIPDEWCVDAAWKIEGFRMHFRSRTAGWRNRAGRGRVDGVLLRRGRLRHDCVAPRPGRGTARDFVASGLAPVRGASEPGGGDVAGIF